MVVTVLNGETESRRSGLLSPSKSITVQSKCSYTNGNKLFAPFLTARCLGSRKLKETIYLPLVLTVKTHYDARASNQGVLDGIREERPGPRYLRPEHPRSTVSRADSAEPSLPCQQPFEAVLTFVVGKKLEGREDEIKERTIGIELFGRIADFETSGDSIVRVNASEVRRRLGQYYQSRRTDPVQIVLPPGTYVPEFVFQEIAAPAARPVGRGAPYLASSRAGHPTSALPAVLVESAP